MCEIQGNPELHLTQNHDKFRQLYDFIKQQKQN